MATGTVFFGCSQPFSFSCESAFARFQIGLLLREPFSVRGLALGGEALLHFALDLRVAVRFGHGLLAGNSEKQDDNREEAELFHRGFRPEWSLLIRTKSAPAALRRRRVQV